MRGRGEHVVRRAEDGSACAAAGTPCSSSIDGRQSMSTGTTVPGTPPDPIVFESRGNALRLRGNRSHGLRVLDSGDDQRGPKISVRPEWENVTRPGRGLTTSLSNTQ